MGDDNNNYEIERYKTYILYAQGRVDYFTDSINKYLELSILLISLLSAILAIIINAKSKIEYVIPFLPSLGIFSFNILYHSFGNYTKKTEKTMWFYRNHEIKNKDSFIKDIKSFPEDPLEDNKIQLYNLFKYQENYCEIQIRMRKIFLLGLISIVTSVPILFMFFSMWGFIYIFHSITYIFVGICYVGEKIGSEKLKRVGNVDLIIVVLLFSTSVHIGILFLPLDDGCLGIILIILLLIILSSVFFGPKKDEITPERKT